LFVQTHARPDLADRWPEEILMTEHARLRNEAMAALARYEIQFCARQPFRTLSGGQQARLQILLLELAGSTLLLLDEPSSGLNPEETEDMVHWIRDIRDDLGVTVIMVEHDMTLVQRVSDRVLALESGRVIALGDPQQVVSDPQVVRAYLGD